MARKFSFLVVVDGDKHTTETFIREDAQKAKDKFHAARDAGKEAYLYLMPLEDKRCKSSEQSAASTGVPAPEAPIKKAVVDFMSTAKRVGRPRKESADLSI